MESEEEIVKYHKILKLVTGEDIISVIWPSKETQDLYFLEEPYIIKQMSTSDNPIQGAFMMTAWNPFTSDKKIPITLDSIVTITNVKEDLLDYYLKLSEKMKQDNFFDDDSSIEPEPPDVEEEEFDQNTLMEMLQSRKETLH